MSDSLQPHGLQYARLPCPLLSIGVCSNSGPLNQWCYPTMSFSATLFSFCFRSFLASGSFPMSQLFASGSQSIGASASVLPMNIQDWFPLGLSGVISLLSKGLSRVFSSTTVQKHRFFSTQPILWSSSHIRTWLLEKPQIGRASCRERVKAGGKGDDRGWDGLMVSTTWWTWVWVGSGSLWWTG